MSHRLYTVLVVTRECKNKYLCKTAIYNRVNQSTKRCLCDMYDVPV